MRWLSVAASRDPSKSPTATGEGARSVDVWGRCMWRREMLLVLSSFFSLRVGSNIRVSRFDLGRICPCKLQSLRRVNSRTKLEGLASSDHLSLFSLSILSLSLSLCLSLPVDSLRGG